DGWDSSRDREACSEALREQPGFGSVSLPTEESSMPTPLITCPGCRQPLSLPMHAAGQVLKCPRCKMLFRLPGQPGIGSPSVASTQPVPGTSPYSDAPTSGLTRTQKAALVVTGMVCLAAILLVSVPSIRALRSKTEDVVSGEPSPAHTIPRSSPPAPQQPKGG